MSSNPLDTQAFWEERLESQLNLRGTGHRAFDLTYNQWLYQAQLDSLKSLFLRQQVSLQGKRVLDVGSGVGFYVDAYIKEGASSIIGVDIAESSVNYLKKHFPDHQFFVCNIADSPCPFEGPFDLISAVSVLYHIVDDAKFQAAMRNLCTMLSQNGYLLLSDTFQKSPTARHTRFRSTNEYEQIFKPFEIEILEITPIYYLMNHTFIPILGPLLINRLKLGQSLYQMDKWLKNRLGVNMGGMKFLLAKRVSRIP